MVIRFTKNCCYDEQMKPLWFYFGLFNGMGFSCLGLGPIIIYWK